MIDKLDAVNYCLSILGSTPVGSLEDSLHPDADICLTRINEALLTIQKEGWWFNTEVNWALTPDANKDIDLPANTIKVLGIQGEFVIQRGIKLYDSINNTYQFDNAVTVNLIVNLDWDLLPFSVQESAKYLAAQRVCEIDLEDHIKASGEEKQFTASYIQLKKEDLQIEQRNALRSPKAMLTRSGVKPYRRRTQGTNPNFAGG